MQKMGEIAVALVVICAFFVFWKALNWLWLQPKRIEKQLRKQGFNGPSYKFLIGNLKEMVRLETEARSKPMEPSHQIVPRVLRFIHHTVQKYGKSSFTWLGPIPTIIALDPEILKQVFTAKYDEIGMKKFNYIEYLVTGISYYEGEKWTSHRKIINPAFHMEKLKRMLPAFETCCTEMIQQWQHLVVEESFELDVFPYLEKMTADVISRTAFGRSFEDGRKIFQLQSEQAKLLIEASQSLYIPGFRFIPTKRHNRMNAIFKEVRGLLRDMISKREKEMSVGETQDDLLGLLIESNLNEMKENNNSKNVGMSIDDIVEECKLFYLAGQETMSALLVWTMISLSMNPHWQEEARREVYELFGKRKPQFEELNNLKIVTMIIHEVLRLYPSVTYMIKVVHRETKVGKFILPAGAQVVLPILLVHHDTEIWGEDADEFNPNRFSNGVLRATKSNQLAFFPFGWGPKICIGQNFAFIEAKLAITMILQHFSFELSSTYAHAPHTIITLQPQHGAQLILRKI